MNATLTPIDSKGVIGTGLYLLAQGPKLNNYGLSEVVNTITTNYKNLAKVELPKPSERDFVVLQGESLEAKLATRFFKAMTTKEELPYYDKIVNKIAPVILERNIEMAQVKDLQDHEAILLTNWIAGTVATYMTEKQVKDVCTNIDRNGSNDAYMDKRMALGTDLYRTFQGKNIPESDFDAFLSATKTAVEFLKTNTINFTTVMKYVGGYLELFSISAKPEEDSNNVFDMFSTVFRKKLYPA